MNTAEVLLKAADVLAERGWNRDGFTPLDVDTWPDGERALCPVDVLAAIAIAAAGDLERDCDFTSVLASTKARPAVLAFAAHLGLGETGRRHGFVAVLSGGWNDDVARSGEHVIAELRAAAADLQKASTS